MPTLRQLEYLVTVAELGSFTRAASELHVSQPTLSSQIAVLEHEVGSPLLDRQPRTVLLTPAGRALVPHARSALTEARLTVAAARRASGLDAGELTIATVYSAMLGLLPSPLRRWRQAYPGIRLKVLEYRHGDALVEATRRGDADVAVGPTPLGWEGTVVDLGEEELVVVVADDDPLAEQNGPLKLSALADRAWIHFASGHGLGDLLDDACANAGFSPTVALRTEQTASAPLLAAAGVGPTLVPASIVPDGFDGRMFSTSPPTTRPLAVYHRSNGDPLTTAFTESIASGIDLTTRHTALRRQE